ncbi:MAG: hypothetical protein F4156_14295 [Holophagales bacterium]|nr:hypothetical protein [Holophagales bacterium]
MLFFAVAPIAGCARAQADDLMRQDRFWPLWPLLAFVFALVLGATAVRIQYNARLGRWDLRQSALDPGVGQGFLFGYIVAAILFVGVPFTIFNLTVEAIDPAQRWLNIFLWWLGGTIGCVAGWLFGKRAAARGFG